MAFFEKAQKVGNVSSLQDLRAGWSAAALVERAGRGDPRGGIDRRAQSRGCRRSVAGETVIEVKNGSEAAEEGEEEEEELGGERPAFYSEAYVPVKLDGKVVGIMEAYVDQSAKGASFHKRIGGVAVSLAAISRDRLRPAGNRLHLADAAEAAGRSARQLPRRSRCPDRHPEPYSLHGESRRSDPARAAPSSSHTIDIKRFGQVNDMFERRRATKSCGRWRGGCRRSATSRICLGDLAATSSRSPEIVRNMGQVDADRAAHRPRRLARRSTWTNATPIFQLSVGSAVAPAHGEDAATLLRNAEIALAHAKNTAQSSRSLFPSRDGRRNCRRNASSRRRFADAVADGTFELMFQPLYQATDRRLAGFEALLRLPKGDGGHVSPAVFHTARRTARPDRGDRRLGHRQGLHRRGVNGRPSSPSR